MVLSLEPLVLGLDPTLGGSVNARAWKELNFLGYEGVTIQALAGIDMALWDLRGKAAELNVSRFIGGVREAAPVYASGGLWLSSSIDELQREASDFIAAGFRTVKMRVAPGKAEAMVARVRAVREAIGPEIGLMVDANQQLSVSEAIHLGRALEPFNLTWFEEPVICHNHEGEAAVAATLDTPIASGETVHTHRGVLRMLQARAADILMPDIQRMGGTRRVPQSRGVVRGFQHADIVASLPGSEPALARRLTKCILPGIHALVQVALRTEDCVGRRGPSDCSNYARLGRKL